MRTHPMVKRIGALALAALAGGIVLSMSCTALAAGTAATSTVTPSPRTGTAKAGTDYTSSSGVLNFADGQTSATFTIPKAPVRRRVHGIDTFNVLRGGEYFFMPSLSALRWIGSLAESPQRASLAPRAPDRHDAQQGHARHRNGRRPGDP